VRIVGHDVNVAPVAGLRQSEFESGWYVQWQPTITDDWTAGPTTAWSIPMGADVGKVLKVGGRGSSVQFAAYDLLQRPDGLPHRIVRASTTFLLPELVK